MMRLSRVISFLAMIPNFTWGQIPLCFSDITHYTVLNPATYNSAVHIDVNGDHKKDLAMVSYSTLSIFTSDSSGSFTPALSYTLPGQARALITDDFNSDGIADLALSSGSGDIIVFPGAQSGGFAAPVFNVSGSYPTVLVSKDFNGDGKTDIVANALGGELAVFMGMGNCSFAPAVLDTTYASSFISAISEDFNLDGKPDLMLGWIDTLVKIRINKGDGTFAPPVHQWVGNPPHSLASKDFNGDGKPDVVTTGWQKNKVRVLLGTGTATFINAGDFPAGKHPAHVSIADFNADGKNDIVTTNMQSGNLIILPGDGTGNFLAPFSITLTIQPVFELPADLDMDGRMDLLVLYNSVKTHFSTIFNCREVLSVSDESKEQLLNVLPNPVCEDLIITSAKETNITLYDLSSNLILRQKINAGPNRIPLDGLPAGVYWMYADQNESRSYYKIIVAP